MSQTWIRVGGWAHGDRDHHLGRCRSRGGGFRTADVIDPVDRGQHHGGQLVRADPDRRLVVGLLRLRGDRVRPDRAARLRSHGSSTPGPSCSCPSPSRSTSSSGQAVGDGAAGYPSTSIPSAPSWSGALAGPIPGALTGLLSNLIWCVPRAAPPERADLRRLRHRGGGHRAAGGNVCPSGLVPARPNTPTPRSLVGGVLAIALILVDGHPGLAGVHPIMGEANLAPSSDNLMFVALGWLALLLVVGTVVGLVLLLAVKRDLTAAYVVVMGVLTGLVAAAVSAPIARTCSAGSPVRARTSWCSRSGRQVPTSTPRRWDRASSPTPSTRSSTFFVVYLVLGAMALRTKARFPQGELLIERPPYARGGLIDERRIRSSPDARVA